MENKRKESTDRQDTAASGVKEKHSRLRKHRRRNIMLNLLTAAISGSVLLWTADYFTRHWKYEITNDAFVDQYVSPVNIRVSGYVKEIRFSEHEYVKKGDTLLVLDDTEYTIGLREAEAELMDALAQRRILEVQLNMSESNIKVKEADEKEASARLWQLEQDYLRFGRLLAEKAVSAQQYEQAKASFTAAEAKHESLAGLKEVSRLKYDETKKMMESADADIQLKQVKVDRARLDLSYTVITAPYDGYIGRRSIGLGQYVKAGTTLSQMVRSSDKWITANYKETQISSIYPGQPVNIRVDAVPGKVFHGRVTAISGATGSKYSLVPTDNSAGNFVKVQQRIPVRIEIEDADESDMMLLRAGMMAETEAVKTRRTPGRK